LGIRQQLLILLLARSPSITPALFALLSLKVPIRTFVIPQSGPIPELPSNAQPISIRPGPIALLSAIANQARAQNHLNILYHSSNSFIHSNQRPFLILFSLCMIRPIGSSFCQIQLFWTFSTSKNWFPLYNGIRHWPLAMVKVITVIWMAASSFRHPLSIPSSKIGIYVMAFCQMDEMRFS
jgi:hypothetical protein